MNEKKKSKSAAPKPTACLRDQETRRAQARSLPPKPGQAGAKSKAAVVKSRKAKTETVAAPAAKPAAKTRKSPAAKRKSPSRRTKTRKVGRLEDAAG